ncbi:hypothetical protein BY996DRAFT_8531093 [Phakopsora pachyrhizi]|nr:hypothetical protein BY996DRAFT_8531093 [Phakopsora pachyrhizi]
MENIKDGKMSTERKSTICMYGLLLAQWAGSRPDLFPLKLCEYFGKLHLSVKPPLIYHTRRVIEKAFGKKIKEIFVTFNPEPLGVGAVAQVYQATLRPDIIPLSFFNPKHVDQKSQMTVTDITHKLSTSEVEHPPMKPSSTVAIKVLHPRVGKNINKDLKIMNFLANLINTPTSHS